MQSLSPRISTVRGLARAGRADPATLVLCVASVLIAALLVRRELIVKPPPPPPPPTAIKFDSQPDWEQYADVGRRLGSADAPVVLVKFSDFQCPACAQLAGVLEETRRKYPTHFAVVYRHYPLRGHTAARPAAAASECAGQQGRFEAMHSLLFSERSSLALNEWGALAARAGVQDSAEFARCLRAPEVDSIIERDLAVVRALELRGTPSILIDGLRYTGSLPQRVVDSIVKAAIATRRVSSRPGAERPQ